MKKSIKNKKVTSYKNKRNPNKYYSYEEGGFLNTIAIPGLDLLSNISNLKNAKPSQKGTETGSTVGSGVDAIANMFGIPTFGIGEKLGAVIGSQFNPEPIQKYVPSKNTSGNWVSYQKGGTKKKPIQLPVVTVTEDAPQWLNYRREYNKKNPFNIDEYVERRFNQPFGRKEKIAKINPEEFKENLRNEGIINHSKASNTYVAKRLLRDRPQGSMNRQEWLSLFTPKELEIISNSNLSNKIKPSAWSKFEQGLLSIGNAGSPVQLKNENLSQQEARQENNPLNILTPLGIPAKVVQAPFRTGYTVSDAVRGEGNDATLAEDLLTDPLNYVGMGPVANLSRANKLRNATNIGKILNKTDDLSNVRKLESFNNPDEFYRVIAGDEAFNDIVTNNVVRTKPNLQKSTEGSISLGNRPTAFPSFSKGKASVEYANSNPNNYIIVSSDPSIKPSTIGRHGKGTTMFPTDDAGKQLSELSGEKVSVYKHTGDGNYQLVYNKGKKVKKQDNSKSEINWGKEYFGKIQAKEKELGSLLSSKKITYDEYIRLNDEYKRNLAESLNLGNFLGRGTYGEVFELAETPEKVVKLGRPMGNRWTPEIIESLKTVSNNNIAIPEKVEYFEIPSQYKGYSSDTREVIQMPNLNKIEADNLNLNKRDRYALFLKQVRQLRDKGIKVDVDNSENFSFNKNKGVFDIYDVNPGNITNPVAYMQYVHRKTKKPLFENMSFQKGGFLGAKALSSKKGKFADPYEVYLTPEHAAYLSDLNTQYNFPEGLLEGVTLTESGGGGKQFGKLVYKPRAGVKSNAGAKGYFQFTDATAKDYGLLNNELDLRDDFQESAQAAAKMLNDNINRFGSTDKALMAYNWGPVNVEKYLNKKQKGKNPNIPKETKKYIDKVNYYSSVAAGNPWSIHPDSIPKVTPDKFVYPNNQKSDNSNLILNPRYFQAGGNVQHQAEIEGNEYIFNPNKINDVNFKMFDNTGKKYTSDFGFLVKGNKHGNDPQTSGIKVGDGEAYIASQHLGIDGKKSNKNNPSVASLMLKNGGKALAGSQTDKYGINKYTPNAVQHHLNLMTEVKNTAETGKIKNYLKSKPTSIVMPGLR